MNMDKFNEELTRRIDEVQNMTPLQKINILCDGYVAGYTDKDAMIPLSTVRSWVEQLAPLERFHAITGKPL